MSGADLFEDGFPHSTKEGYRAGCRGRACPGVAENGISCAEAYSRYQGDYGFKKRVDAGMSASEIVAEEKTFAKPRPVKKPTVKPLSVEAAAAVELVEAVPAEVELPAEPEPAGREVAYEKHGTPKGYFNGCRLRDSCPGIERVGKSCTQAVVDYQREMKENRRRRASEAVDAAREDVESPREPESEEDEVTLTVGETDAEFVAGVELGEAAPEEVASGSVDELLVDLERAESRLDEVEREASELKVENGRLLALTGTQTDTILALRAELAESQSAWADAHAKVNAMNAADFLSLQEERDALRAANVGLKEKLERTSEKSSGSVVELQQTSLGSARQVSITISLEGL